MTDKQDLERLRVIILATLDYFHERVFGNIVFDDVNNAVKFHEKQRLKIENYYQEGSLDKLEQQLSKLTMVIQSIVDINFSSYIKKNTGYEFDPFESLARRVETMVAQNEIRNDEEAHWVSIMLSYNYQTSVNKKHDKNLLKLLKSYSGNHEKSTIESLTIISKVDVIEV